MGNKINTKFFLLLTLAMLQTAISLASSGIEKTFVKETIELKQIGNNLVQISGNLIAKDESTYFILEKSTDNIHFNQVSIIFALTENDHFYSTVFLKDKTTNAKKVFYRLLKVQDNKASISYTKHIEFK